jgi:hypothetical protein
MNSAYVQIEAIGAFFSLVYLTLVYFNIKNRSPLVIVLEGLFLMLATLTKEPFYLVIFALSLVMFSQIKQWVYHFVIPSIIGGLIGLILLYSINAHASYFFVYLPHMFGEHLDYYGSPLIRGFNILKLFQDLEYHLDILPSVFIITCFICIFTYFFVRGYHLWLKPWIQINLIIRYAITIYIVSFVVGLGGQYYNHHFVFALPFFVVLGVQLSLKLSKTSNDYFERLTSNLLIIFFSLSISVNYFNLPSFVEPLPLIQLQKNMRIHAQYIDDLMSFYEFDSYQFVGFNGPQFYGHTKILAEGPVFFQDPRNFTREDSWFVQQFLMQIERVDMIVLHSVSLDVIQDLFFAYLESDFSLLDHDSLTLVNLNRPTTFNDQIYVRNDLE